MNFRKLSNLSYTKYKIENIKKTTFAFIHEWLTYDDCLFGIGVDIENNLCYIEPDIKFGLYVMVNNRKDLQILKNLKYVTGFTKIPSINLSSVNFTIVDLIEKSCNTDSVLYKLFTNSFNDSMELFYLFTNNFVLGKFFIPTCVWNLDLFILFEKFVKTKTWHENYCYYIWLNNELETLTELKNIPEIITLAFDVETVSPDKSRIPTGELYSDYISSASVSIYDNGHLIQHSLVHIPLPVDVDIEQELKQNDPLKINENVDEHHFYYFHSEYELLRKLFKLFEMGNKSYVLLGYNSKRYDMPYLLFRAMLLQMDESENFYIQHGIICYGYNMIHIDLMLIMMKFYKQEVENFKLNTIAEYCLKETKADVDAVAIRFTFEEILKSGKIKSFYGKQIPIVSDIIYYNDVDTILLINLWNKLSYGTTIPDICKDYSISLSRLCQSEVNEYMQIKLFSKVMETGRFFSVYHKQIVFDNNVINFEENITENQSTFSGGLNYCDSRSIYEKIYCNDFVAYYPYLIGGFNLSHETIAILRVDEIKMLSNLSRVLDDYIFYRFNNHKNDNKLATIMETREYINGSKYIGGPIRFTDILNLSNHEKILIINTRERGILVDIIESQNAIRDNVKLKFKNLESLEELISNQLIEKEFIVEGSEFDDNEFDITNDAEVYENMEDDYDVIDETNPTIDDCEVDPSSTINGNNMIDYKVEIKNSENIKKLTSIELKNYFDIIIGEKSRIHSIYRSLKIVNSSIYGILGSKFGGFRGLHVAAAATFLGRYHILLAAQHGIKNGFICSYIDTDSVFLSTTDVSENNNLAKIMKDINPCLELTTKIYSPICIFAKKTYIAQSSSIMSRGINRYGPKVWENVLSLFMEKYIINLNDVTTTTTSTTIDLDEVGKFLFDMTYDLIEKDRSILLVSLNVQEIEEYKTNTPAVKYMRLERIRNENVVFGKKITCFHELIDLNPSILSYRSVDDLYNVGIGDFNLVKFYNKLITPIYNLIDLAFSRYLSKKYKINYSLKKEMFIKILYQTFKDCRKRRLLKRKID